MRILHVTPTYLPAVRYGGPIYSVHNLCRALVARGHEVEVFTTSIDGPSNSDVSHERPVPLDGVTVRYFQSTHLRRLSWAPEMARDMQRHMHRFDLVHGHSVFLWPTWAARRLAVRSGRPYVLSPRGALVDSLIRRRNSLLKRTWIALIEQLNVERASAIHVTSPLEAQELERFDWKLPRVSIIPNGIEKPGETPPATGVPPDIRALSARQPLTLFFGRLCWTKGLDRLLRAFVSAPGHLAIVGTPDEDIAPDLSRLAVALGISDRVHILARTVVGADKEFIFAAAKVFVLPSYSESFGNTVLEAMVRGIPVVVTPEVGVKDFVLESRGGLVADAAPESLGSAISQLIQNAAQRHEMSQCGALHARTHYGWTGVAEQMEALYTSLMNSPGQVACST